MATIFEALTIGRDHHRAGRLDVAEKIYRQILQADPNQAEAIHLLGVLVHQTGRHELAAEYLGRAIGLNGAAAHFHCNLAKVYQALQRFPEAAGCCRRALELKPDYGEAYVNLGAALKELGKLEDAIAALQRAAELRPDLASAHANLGIALMEAGQLDEAVACCRRALELEPGSAQAYHRLGQTLRVQGRWGEAIVSERRAVALNPALAEAHDTLGAALRDIGDLEEALACHRRALELKPAFATAHNHLGMALMDQGKRDEAAASFRQAVALRPHFVQAHNNLGVALRKRGQPEEAAASCRRALELAPDFIGAHYNLGLALKDQGKLTEAIACFRRVLEAEPDLAEAFGALGAAFWEQGKLDDAISSLRRALELRPDLVEARSNLAVILKDAGLLDESIDSSRRALALEPDNGAIHSNLILTLHYHPAHDGASIDEEHERWSRRFAEPLRASHRPHANDPDPDRPLRIGYVSPDFRDHVVGRYALPVIARHDHARFTVFCYASVTRPDALTGRFQEIADVWRPVAGLPNEAVANLIRDDEIDILIDLSLHTAGSRLLVFASKPAPVQVAWLGYPGNTGLSTIDYLLTDPYLDPVGVEETPASEEPVRLPHTALCFQPPPESPAVSALPALSAGRLTFGCLNNFSKVNKAVIALWSQVLGAVEASHLLLWAKHGAHRDRVLKEFERHGTAADRIEWYTPGEAAAYWAAYQRIDIGLDPFPYNGYTTSLDTAWMGIPIVTLVGKAQVGRAGLSVVTNLGMPELAAASPEQYVQIAAELAQDLPRLRGLRATLRDRMRASPLMDAPRFAQDIEAAYREMWRRWCEDRREAMR